MSDAGRAEVSVQLWGAGLSAFFLHSLGLDCRGQTIIRLTRKIAILEKI